MQSSASGSVVTQAHFPDFVKKRAAFQKAIESEDPLGQVIRTHIVIEGLLQTIVTRNMPKSYERTSKQKKFTYSLNLARALYLCEEGTYEATFMLDSIRNAYAHDEVEHNGPKDEDGISHLKLTKLMGYLEGNKVQPQTFDKNWPLHVQLTDALTSLFVIWIGTRLSDDIYIRAKICAAENLQLLP